MEKSTPRLRIAYVSVNDPLDKRSWSGITYYLGQSLQRNVGEVDFLGPVRYPRFITRLLWGVVKFSRVFFNSKYFVKYSLLHNRYASMVLQRKLKRGRYDCIIAPAAAPELAYIKTDLPIIYMGDATYRLLYTYYTWDFHDQNRLSRWEGAHLEKRALRKCSLLIMASHWAARSVVQDYGVAPEKVHMLTMGANMDTVPGREIMFRKEDNKTLTLLYLAVEWERKGGRIAFQALERLHAMGIEARLVVCGCIPPPEFAHSHMQVIPFLNKNKKEDHDLFVHLLSTSHFLLLPTRADCSLLVACESNAYGMPAIATDIGGVSDVVKDGVNGYCLPFAAEGAAYAQLIAEIFSDKERYHRLIASSRQRFEEALNWDQWAARFKEIYRDHFLQQPQVIKKNRQQPISEV